jgi:hypothetical protein
MYKYAFFDKTSVQKLISVVIFNLFACYFFSRERKKIGTYCYKLCLLVLNNNI